MLWNKIYKWCSQGQGRLLFTWKTLTRELCHGMLTQAPIALICPKFNFQQLKMWYTIRPLKMMVWWMIVHLEVRCNKQKAGGHSLWYSLFSAWKQNFLICLHFPFFFSLWIALRVGDGFYIIPVDARKSQYWEEKLNFIYYLLLVVMCGF